MNFDLSTVEGTRRQGVTYIQWEPGDATRYAFFLSELPCDAEGGTTERHILVSLTCPGETAAYAFSTLHNPLHEDYVREKLRCSWYTANVLTLLLGEVLDRKPLLDPEWIATNLPVLHQYRSTQPTKG